MNSATSLPYFCIAIQFVWNTHVGGARSELQYTHVAMCLVTRALEDPK